jgi:hydroxypyruvate isomerase
VSAPFALAGVTYGTIGKISGAPRTKAEFDGTARFIERAARAAKAHGLKLGIEPCNRYETHIMNTGADGRAYCEAAGQDNVFIHLDSYHMNIEERSPSRKASAIAAIGWAISTCPSRTAPRRGMARSTGPRSMPRWSRSASTGSRRSRA